MQKDSEIIIVSGLPRSGTSMMMHMLQAGGIDLVDDDKRPADQHNPNGYFEFEKVKSLEENNSWIGDYKGKAIKILFHLLKFLPKDLNYKIIFMQRDLNEVLFSQDKMLKNYGKPVQQDNDQIKSIFENELQEVKMWVNNQKNMDIIFIQYNEAITATNEVVSNIENFLMKKLDSEKMSFVVTPVLSSNI